MTAENECLLDRVEELEQALGWDIRPALMLCAKLSKPEAATVAALLRREICTIEQLHFAVYGERPVDERPEYGTVALHMHCVRKKLKMIDVEITTLRFVGYALDCENRKRLVLYMEKRAPVYMNASGAWLPNRRGPDATIGLTIERAHSAARRTG